MSRGRWLVAVLVMSTALAAEAAPAPAAAPAVAQPEAGGQAVEQLEVGADSVLERLKLLRVQMALDREEIAALELRIKKLQLQRDFEAAVGGGKVDKKAGGKPAGPSAGDILVKSISTKPRKEAYILYRGRMFTVRPGDRIGDIEIQDITEQGLQIAGSRGRGPAIVR